MISSEHPNSWDFPFCGWGLGANRHAWSAGKIIGCEYAVLDEWFKFLTGPDSALPLNVDLIIYLRTTPEKALERINVRARSEENTIPLEYIQQLHSLHEEWLISGKYPLPAPVLVIDADKVRQNWIIVKDSEQ